MDRILLGRPLCHPRHDDVVAKVARRIADHDRHGLPLADAVVEVRAGALSTDEHSLFLGTPDFPLPVVSGVTGQTLVIPSLNLFKRAEAKATVKFAATGYDPKTGKLVIATEPQTSNAHKVDWSVLLLFSWTDEDYSMAEKH